MNKRVEICMEVGHTSLLSLIPNQGLIKLKGTAIPRDTLPVDMLTPQIRHCELRQKNSRYATFSDFFLPPAMLFLILSQNFQTRDDPNPDL